VKNERFIDRVKFLFQNYRKEVLMIGAVMSFLMALLVVALS